VVRGRVIGLERNRALTAGDGEPELALIGENFPEIPVGFGIVGKDAKCPANEVDGGGVVPRLMRYHAEQVKRAGMIRILAEDVAIKFLGLAQSTGAVVLDGELQRLREGV